MAKDFKDLIKMRAVLAVNGFQQIEELVPERVELWSSDSNTVHVEQATGYFMHVEGDDVDGTGVVELEKMLQSI